MATPTYTLHTRRSGPESAEMQIILVHGAMDSSASMTRLAAALPGRSIVRYDRRGYGKSPLLVGQPPPSLSDHIGDLRALVDDIPTVLVGHSLGAAICLAVAQCLPNRVAGVVAYEPPLPWESWWPAPPLPEPDADACAVREAAEQFMRRAMGDNRWEGLAPEARSAFLTWGPVWASELRDAAGSPVFDASRLTVPVVVAYGSDTDERHRRGAIALAGDVRSSTLIEVPGGTHVAHRRKPEELAEIVSRLSTRIDEDGRWG